MRRPPWFVFVAAIGIGGGGAFTLHRVITARAGSNEGAPSPNTVASATKSALPSTTHQVASISVPPRPHAWVDDLDPNDPPPASQLDPEHLASLVDILPEKRNAETLAYVRKLVRGERHFANQGNPAISHHKISRRQCLEGLRDVVVQTDAQRAICGAPNEVPIHTGDPDGANTCVDVFEYPNKACVLPFVHMYGMQAEDLCALDGKRLCTDQEWDQACEDDPAGGAAWQYAYGNEMDLKICSTQSDNGHCRINDDLWGTCETNTEPSGAFPGCRSRLGVFDQHGNVAEFMHRWEGGVDYIQMKGSAFFYTPKLYRDHCRFDPRWHVDPFRESWHDNYHLGFRCCRSIKPLRQRIAEDAGAHFATGGADAGEAPSDYDEEIASDASTPVPTPSASSSEEDPYEKPEN